MRASPGPMIAAVEKIELSPQSRPANGACSTSQGAPIISLEMAAQNKLLRCSSRRLSGLLTITGGSACDGADGKVSGLSYRTRASNVRSLSNAFSGVAICVKWPLLDFIMPFQIE